MDITVVAGRAFVGIAIPIKLDRQTRRLGREVAMGRVPWRLALLASLLQDAPMVDVTDATFETDVIEASHQAAIVVDLWAEWCGPCKTLGPILEKVIAETNGKVVLAKVDVDANPATSQAFQVQSIPAVYAMKDGKVVNGFVGAQGEPAVREFVQSLMPTDAELQIEQLLAVGDEESLLKVLELVPDHHVAVPAVAELLIARGENEMALELLQKVPETAEVRRIAAMARIGGEAHGCQAHRAP